MIRSVNIICFEGSKGCELSGFRACLSSIWSHLGGLFAQSGASEGIKREVEKNIQIGCPKAKPSDPTNLDEGGVNPSKSKFLRS